MTVLAGILSVLGLALSLMAIVGLVSPSLFRNKKTGEVPKRSQLFLGGTVASLIAFGVSGAIVPEKAKSPNVEPAPASAEAPPTQQKPAPAVEPMEEKSRPTLGVSLAAFAKRFNAHMVKLEQPYRLHPQVTNQIFSVALNDHLGLSAGISEKSGELTNVMIIGGGDGTPKSGLATMSVVAGAFAAVLGLDDVKTTGPEVLAVLKAHQENPDGKATRILNGTKLFYTQNEMMGNFFAIEPASL